MEKYNSIIISDNKKLKNNENKFKLISELNSDKSKLNNKLKK
jgi:hypothetical protein